VRFSGECFFPFSDGIGVAHRKITAGTNRFKIRDTKSATFRFRFIMSNMKVKYGNLVFTPAYCAFTTVSLPHSFKPYLFSYSFGDMFFSCGCFFSIFMFMFSFRLGFSHIQAEPSASLESSVVLFLRSCC